MINVDFLLLSSLSLLRMQGFMPSNRPGQTRNILSSVQHLKYRKNEYKNAGNIF